MKKAALTYNQWVEKVFVGRRPSLRWILENAMCPRKAEWLVTYPTRLFEEPEFLISKYSYLKTHPDLPSHIREYAFAAIKGRVL
jgi:hypothetical protein